VTGRGLAATHRPVPLQGVPAVFRISKQDARRLTDKQLLALTHLAKGSPRPARPTSRARPTGCASWPRPHAIAPSRLRMAQCILAALPGSKGSPARDKRVWQSRHTRSRSPRDAVVPAAPPCPPTRPGEATEAAARSRPSPRRKRWSASTWPSLTRRCADDAVVVKALQVIRALYGQTSSTDIAIRLCREPARPGGLRREKRSKVSVTRRGVPRIAG